jgi:hypothetical protein
VTRWWDEMVAGLTDVISMPLLMLLSLVATALISLGWYFWPRWLPWNWRFGRSSASLLDSRRGESRQRHRWRIGSLRWRLRWRRRRRGARKDDEPLADLPPDELPDLPAEVLILTADQLAAAGRYGEAVRERLRAIVRDLIDREVIPHSPGWTVTELARAAARVRPSVSDPLDGAVDVFSEIWYGLRPAVADDDAAMRGYAASITRLLGEPAQLSETNTASPADGVRTANGATA